MGWAYGAALAAVLTLTAPVQALAAPGSGSGDAHWGLYARAGGRAFDWRSRDSGWTPDPAAASGDVEAGYGLRRGRLSALVGYEQPAAAPADVADRQSAYRPAIPLSDGAPPGVLGLGLVARFH
ncbi:MAG: hypothetical protein JO127_04905 [Caulobacteraceae bacterium]|nr:hypothetical protein [Caulobacteraceae bacterium]